MTRITSRLLPHPILSLLVAAVWVGLTNNFSLGHALLGLALGLVVPWFTSIYWPDQVVVKHPARLLGYIGIVFWDIVVSNIQVARLVLFVRSADLRSQFVAVPLDLQTPEAIAMLASTITMTPGTLSADLSADGTAILVHCLDAADPEQVVRNIKTRYERRLKDIFE
jgi:multicomponent K+:H+ antiporter subunit E